MKQYNYRYCPVVKLACGEVHVLSGNKGRKFLSWFIYVHKADVYDPLKERVWVIEYGRPDEEKKNVSLLLYSRMAGRTSGHSKRYTPNIWSISPTNLEPASAPESRGVSNKISG